MTVTTSSLEFLALKVRINHLQRCKKSLRVDTSNINRKKNLASTLLHCYLSTWSMMHDFRLRCSQNFNHNKMRNKWSTIVSKLFFFSLRKFDCFVVTPKNRKRLPLDTLVCLQLIIVLNLALFNFTKQNTLFRCWLAVVMKYICAI